MPYINLNLLQQITGCFVDMNVHLDDVRKVIVNWFL